MAFASQLAKSYSNPDAVWNSLGAVGSTSAWDPSSADISALRDILNFARTSRVTRPTERDPSNALAFAKVLSSAEDLGPALAGKYIDRYTNKYLGLF